MSKTKSFFSVATASAEGKVAKQLEACLAAVVKLNAVQYVVDAWADFDLDEGQFERLQEMVKKKTVEISDNLDFYIRRLISVRIENSIDRFIGEMLKEEEALKAGPSVDQVPFVAKKKKMSASQPKTPSR
jgi:hypothetical protein